MPSAASSRIPTTRGNGPRAAQVPIRSLVKGPFEVATRHYLAV